MVRVDSLKVPVTCLTQNAQDCHYVQCVTINRYMQQLGFNPLHPAHFLLLKVFTLIIDKSLFSSSIVGVVTCTYIRTIKYCMATFDARIALNNLMLAGGVFQTRKVRF